MRLTEEQEKELSALIKLLEDPDKEVHKHVVGKIMSYGTDIIPSLESAWESSLDPELQQRIIEVIHQLQFEVLLKDFEKWVQQDKPDLLQGALLVARYQYPDLNEEDIQQQLGLIKRDIWVELNFNLTPLEQVNVFNQIFYSLYKFTGNITHILDPDNHYINKILETKKGNPISLGLIYLIIAQSLDIPLYGVNLPHHFILTYSKDYIADFTPSPELKNKLLFYINPFNNGMIFTRNEIKLFLKKIKLEAKEEYFLPCSNVEVIQALVTSLMTAYKEKKSEAKIEELQQLLNLTIKE